jgi:VanZ family protein
LVTSRSNSNPSGSGSYYSFLFMKRSTQVLAWVLVLGIVGLSIVPPDYRISTDLPRPFEHLSIFLLTGLAFGVGYPDRYPMQSISLVLFAAAIELIQVWVPGRHPRLSDFAAGVLGLGLGIGLAYVSTRMARGRMAQRETKAHLCSAVSRRRHEAQVPGLRKAGPGG